MFLGRGAPREQGSGCKQLKGMFAYHQLEQDAQARRVTPKSHQARSARPGAPATALPHPTAWPGPAQPGQCNQRHPFTPSSPRRMAQL